MGHTYEDGTVVLDKPEEIKMFGLLQARARLHIEMNTGMGFRQSTLGALQRAGITDKRTKKGALADLNQLIAAHGGPEDTHKDRASAVMA